MHKELIGETLAEARRLLNKSIKEVEFDTKIRGRYIEALERDDFSSLPADIYTQGFIKTYAAYLGLDPQPLIQQYKSMYAEPQHNDLAALSSNMKVETQRRPIWFKPAIATAAVVAVFIMLLAVGAINKSIAREPKVKVENIKVRKTLETVVAATTTSTTEQRYALSNPSDDTSSNSTTTSTTDDISSNTMTGESSEGGVKVKLTGIEGEGSWVKVSVDGEKKYVGVVEDGVSKLFEADESVTVRIGNATGLEVMLNGKKISTKKFKSVNGIIEATFKAGSSSDG